MKICPGCGAQVDDDARFCTGCGASMADAPVKEDQEVEETVEEEDVKAEPAEPVEVIGEAPAEPVEVTEKAPEADTAPIAPIATIDNGYSSGPSYQAPNARAGVGTERNIILCIVFSIITCGIYGLYWIYVLNRELNELAGEREYTDGALVIIFSLITCGIYALYWNYKMGEKVDIINGNRDGNMNIIFLLLTICELSIVNLAIMQDTVNKTVKNG